MLTLSYKSSMLCQQNNTNALDKNVITSWVMAGNRLDLETPEDACPIRGGFFFPKL